MKMHNVNHPKDGNRYCGPAVISAATGCTTKDAATLLRWARYGDPSRGSIKGATTSEVTTVLKHWGIKVERKPHNTPESHRPTLTQWLRHNKANRTAGRVYLIVAGNHWQMVSGRKYVCGITREVVSIKHPKVKRRARVSEVYELTPNPRIELSDMADSVLNVHDAQRSAQRSTARASSRVKYLAAKYDIPVENDSYTDCGEYCFTRYVGMPSWLDTDPLEDGHYAYDWDDCLWLVEFYAKHHPSHPEHDKREFLQCSPWN